MPSSFDCLGTVKPPYTECLCIAFTQLLLCPQLSRVGMVTRSLRTKQGPGSERLQNEQMPDGTHMAHF